MRLLQLTVAVHHAWLSMSILVDTFPLDLLNYKLLLRRLSGGLCSSATAPGKTAMQVMFFTSWDLYWEPFSNFPLDPPRSSLALSLETKPP